MRCRGKKRDEINDGIIFDLNKKSKMSSEKGGGYVLVDMFGIRGRFGGRRGLCGPMLASLPPEVPGIV